MRLTPFPDVLIASGAGVGGGSLGYANTLYRARETFFEDPRWRELADWKAELDAHYQTAERMLGVTDVTFDSDGDILLRELAAALGVEETYGHTRVGVYLGEPGVEHPDPYFDGDGPARTGCIRCGECMVGCRHGAKNTLVKTICGSPSASGSGSTRSGRSPMCGRWAPRTALRDTRSTRP